MRTRSAVAAGRPRSPWGSPAAADPRRTARSPPRPPDRPRRSIRTRPRSARRATSPTTRPSSPTARPARGYAVKVPEGWARTSCRRRDDVHRQAQRDPGPDARRRPRRAPRGARPSCRSSRTVRATSPGGSRPSPARPARPSASPTSPTHPRDAVDRQDGTTPSSATSSSTTAGRRADAVGPEGRRQRRPVEDRHRLAAVDAMTRRCEADSLYPLLPRRRRRDARPAGRLADASRPARSSPSPGPSGSGKSTLLACLAGLDEPDGGMVTHRRRAAVAPPGGGARRACARAASGCSTSTRTSSGTCRSRGNVALAQRLGDAAPAPATHGAPSCSSAARSRARARARPAPAVRRRARARGPRGGAGQRPAGAARRRADRRARRGHRAARPRRCCATAPTAGAAVLIVTHNPAGGRGADREIRLRDGRVDEREP